MTEDQQNRPGVNLEELERQLRVASRAHAEAAIRANPAPEFVEKTAPVPDLDALRRDFTRTQPPMPQRPATMPVELPDPGPPPAFLSAPPSSVGQPEYSNPFDERFPLIDRGKERGSPIFRALILVVALFLLVSFGYFFYSGKLSLSVSVAPDQKTVPVIKADTNPVKVVPDTNVTSDAAPAGSELFGKKGADTVSSATTKSSAEAPLDVNAAVKANGNKSTSLVPGMGEPKSVRTVTVRPDGTMIGDPTSGAVPSAPSTTPVIVTPSASAMSQEASQTAATPAAPPTNAASAPLKPVQTASAEPSSNLPPLPNVPATLNGGPVPLPPARPNADSLNAAADDPLRDLVAQATNEEPKAVDEPQATNEVPIAGDFAVQFGASPSEAEANSLSARLKTQLAELLGEHPIAVIKADSNGKTVFRVRALGYSRDEAAAACASAAASGAKCFIAKN